MTSRWTFWKHYYPHITILNVGVSVGVDVHSARQQRIRWGCVGCLLSFLGVVCRAMCIMYDVFVVKMTMTMTGKNGKLFKPSRY